MAERSRPAPMGATRAATATATATVRARASRLRADVGQLAWFLRLHEGRESWCREAAVLRGMDLPRLPRRRVRPGEVWAVMMVRDEQDVIGQVVDHLLDQGVDHVLVADNGSVDATRAILTDRARRTGRVHVGDDWERAYHQAEKMSHLARFAWSRGADWVLPCDADEFWFADGMSVAERLRQTPEPIAYASFHHMIRLDEESTPIDGDSRFTMDSAGAFPGKVAFRSHPLAVLVAGNHDVHRVGRRVHNLHIAHAIYRSRDQVARKLRQGAAAASLTGREHIIGSHWTFGGTLTDSDIDAAWARLRAGEPIPELNVDPDGPLVEVRPVGWSTWQGPQPVYRSAAQRGSA